MTKLMTTAVVALMLMVLAIAPASAQVEIRGPIYNGTSLSDIMGSGDLEMNATNFAGFYFDLDTGVSSETLTIEDQAGTNVIAARGLVYNTTIQPVDYEAAVLGDNYSVLGLFAEKYIPLSATTAEKLSKLLLDTDDKYTLRTGTALQLPGGYELTAKQIDVEGNKVWMEFSKDGEFIEDEIIDVSSSGNRLWTYDTDVAGEDDVVVLKVYVSNVFQGQVDSLAVIEGIWLMDYENVMEIETDDKFGVLEVTQASGASIEMDNPNRITLSKGKTVSIAQGMSFKVADTDDALRFYIMKEYTAPGTYEIRGEVSEDGGVLGWNYENFAGFYYDLDTDSQTETLTISTAIDNDNRTIGQRALVYSTTIAPVSYEADVLGDNYSVLGLFAEKYIPLSATTAEKLSKLLLDTDDKYTMRTGTALQLPGGYELTAKQIDVEGNKVWMEFSKDGEFIEDEIIDVSGTNGTSKLWTYDTDVAGEDDVVVLKVYVSNVFQGQVDSLAVIEGIWLMDYENVMEIETDDKFGVFEVTQASGDTIEMDNPNTISLNKGKTVSLAQGMNFKVADDADVLRFYPFVEVTIEGDVTQPDDEDDTETPVDNGTETPGNETPVDETPVDTPVDETPVDTPTEEESPGFEAIFAVAGLLAVAYLVRRN